MAKGDRQRVDRGGFTSAYPSSDGQVHLDFWLEDRHPHDDPLRLTMSPGQALVLIQRVADAAQRALKESINA